MLKRSDPQMMRHRQIILAPIVTEKSMRQSQMENKYTFRVASDANKIEVSQAIEAIFNVRVKTVNTMNVQGKVRRRSFRHREGKTANWKKAIVTLAPGSNIDVLEGGL